MAPALSYAKVRRWEMLPKHAWLQAAEGGVSLYVGHDTNLDGVAVMLGLAWPHAPPYPANTTVPGSILRLTASGGTVSAAYLYTEFENASGAMAEVDAVFPNGESSMPLASLLSRASSRIDKRCPSIWSLTSHALIEGRSRRTSIAEMS